MDDALIETVDLTRNEIILLDGSKFTNLRFTLQPLFSNGNEKNYKFYSYIVDSIVQLKIISETTGTSTVLFHGNKVSPFQD